MSLAIKLKRHSSNGTGHTHLRTTESESVTEIHIEIITCLAFPHSIVSKNAIYTIFPDETQWYY